MAATIPTIEPVSVRAGETWTWSRSLGDYPATGWTLSYRLYNATAAFTVTASADGTDHLVSVAPATTAGKTAGWYDWFAQVTDGTDVYPVGSGRMQVLPDLSAASSYDGRSHARKVLDSINALIEGRATAGDLHVVQTAVDDMTVGKRPELLLQWQRHYAAIVAGEDRAAAIARGEQVGMLQMRFRP